MQRHVLYLGEINSSQEIAWRKSIEMIEGTATQPRSLALFPEDRCEGVLPGESIVRLRLSQLSLRRPRQWGACWLALRLWQELDLDEFWATRLVPSRKGTAWEQVLFVLVAYRWIEPGSEWRLHREWFGRTALADLLSAAASLADPHVLYGCHDRLLAHKEALFSHLVGRWRDLFNVSFEVLPGNTADSTTLRSFLAKIERQYGKAQRIWCMDRGIPTEAVFEEMRASDPPVQYLVGTPKGRLNRLELARTELAGRWAAGTGSPPPPASTVLSTPSPR